MQRRSKPANVTELVAKLVSLQQAVKEAVKRPEELEAVAGAECHH